MSSGPNRAALTIERASQVAPWVALVLVCVAIVLVARARSATCLSLVAAPNPDVAASALASVAVPGPRHDHQSMSDHEFDHDLGAFRLECRSSYDGHYWDYDHCALEVPRCASEPLPVDRYAMFATDLELQQAPGGTYVLSNARGMPYLSFRAEPTGHRVGLARLWLALGALGLALAALALTRMARARVDRFAAWRDGIVEPGDKVRPDDGSAPVPLAPRGLAHGARVRFRSPAAAGDYRSAPEPVEALRGSLVELRRWRAAMEKRALLLVVVSLVASLGVVGSVLASP